jgi:hypothetical protein
MLEFRENPTGFTVVIQGDRFTQEMADAGEISEVPNGITVRYWYSPGVRCLFQDELRQIANKLEELNNEN